MTGTKISAIDPARALGAGDKVFELGDVTLMPGGAWESVGGHYGCREGGICHEGWKGLPSAELKSCKICRNLIGLIACNFERFDGCGH